MTTTHPRLTRTLENPMPTRQPPALRATRLAFAAALVASCGGKSAEKPAVMEATELPCLVARGESLTDDLEPFETDMRGGYQVCMRVLDLYLRAHPDERIVAVLPIEEPPGSRTPHVSVEGTPGLIVVHTSGSGSWPRARDLKIEARLCAAGQGTDLQVGPEHCFDHLRTDLAIDPARVKHDHSAGRIRLFVPITAGLDSPEPGLHAGTSTILWLREQSGEAAK